jgi:hypothetical protein
MALVIRFPLRVNRAGKRIGEPCLGCWSPTIEFEDVDRLPCAWCCCDWPEDESEMEIVEGLASSVEDV